MANLPKTHPWRGRATFGTLKNKNIYSTSFAYTNTLKKIAAGSTTAVMAATNGATAPVTVNSSSSLTQPDVPRVLSVTAGGTSTDVIDSVVTVYGTNVEGAPISESFRFAAGGSGTVNGTKAFRTVTSVVIGQQGGSGATFAVGTTNILGVNHRLFKNNTTVKVYTQTAVDGALTLQTQPTVTASESNIELNTVLPATVPNGSLIFLIAYAYDNWALAPVNDQPEYSTTTSTSSTSSSTSSTTITTSTSSTSSSTSSTSSSTSSTSSSTSSTSTSTTTTP